MKAVMLPLLLLATPAGAQDLREFCGDRPGLGTPACTVDPGHVQVELGLADWTLDKQPDSRTDTILGGDVMARIGVGASTEARIGWTAYGHVRTRDRATGAIDRVARTGDVTLGIKQNLTGADGKGLSVALLPFASVPVGRHPIGAGDWGAGLIVPVDYDLSDKVQVQFTSEIDAAVDEDGNGRHLAYSGTTGLSYDFTDSLSGTAELQVQRDRDPDEHATQALAALSFAYQPTKRSQLDVGAAAGLNHSAPDVELYLGVSEKF